MPISLIRCEVVMIKGLILKGIGGFYYIDTENGVYECKARGVFRKNGITPTVGDFVTIKIVDEENKKGNLEEILERRNILIRPAISNVDNFVIVASVISPPFDTFFVDKLIVICEYSNIRPVILINKTDLKYDDVFGKIYENIGYDVVYTSKDSDISKIYDVISGGINVFSGFSGVGKSTLLNNLIGDIELETGEVSKLTRGRHTTRHSELFKINENTYLADTPGFSSLDINFKIEDLGWYFKEFREYSCKFTGCTHTKEKGCGVLEALENGKINPSRHKSYMQIHEATKEIKHWMRAVSASNPH